MPKINITYQDYLNAWDCTFPSDEPQEYWYWSRGEQVFFTLEKLSEAQFIEHLDGLNKANIEFDAALKLHDEDKMDSALRESFPHELALLV